MYTSSSSTETSQMLFSVIPTLHGTAHPVKGGWDGYQRIHKVKPNSKDRLLADL